LKADYLQMADSLKAKYLHLTVSIDGGPLKLEYFTC